jgi:DNA repair photolyase
MFTDDTCKLEERCGLNDQKYAIVPSPQNYNVPAVLTPLIPALLSHPIHNHVENCKNDLAHVTVMQGKENKWEAELEVKQEEEHQHEEEKWEEEHKWEEAKWEAKWEEECQCEKAEEDKKHEDLRQHLLEVEEMTMDTVGWIAHNVCHCPSIFHVKTDSLKNRT